MKCLLLLAMLVFPCNVCDYTDYYKQDLLEHRQSLATLDTSAIYEGLFKPENIAIHVGQNFINVLVSALAWGLAMALYQGSGGKSSRVKREEESYDYDDYTPQEELSSISAKKLAWLLRSLADTAEKFEKWSPDE